SSTLFPYTTLFRSDGDLAGDPVRVKPYFDRLELLLDAGLDLGAPLAADAAHGSVDRPQLPPYLRVEAAEIRADGDPRGSGLSASGHRSAPLLGPAGQHPAHQLAMSGEPNAPLVALQRGLSRRIRGRLRRLPAVLLHRNRQQRPQPIPHFGHPLDVRAPLSEPGRPRLRRRFLAGFEDLPGKVLVLGDSTVIRSEERRVGE